MAGITASRAIWAGVVVILTGIGLAFGADVYDATKAWLASPSFPPQSIISAILVLVGIAVVLYGVKALKDGHKGRVTVDHRFAHLTIHYSQRTDSPDTPNPARPRYVVNGKTKQAYWFSDLLEPYIKRRIFAWYSHDGEQALREYFTQNSINVHETDPLLIDDLGLIIDEFGGLYPADSPLMVELRGRKLDDFHIICLYPWYDFARHEGLPKNRLLIQHSTMQAFTPPPEDVNGLMAAKIMPRQSDTMRPWDSLKRWCERHHYTFCPDVSAESKLRAYAHANSRATVRIALRRELELELPLEKFLAQAREEIWFLGLSNEDVIGHYGGAIKRLLEEGICINFLLLNPESNLLKIKEMKAFVEGFIAPRASEAISAALGRLDEIKNGLTDIERNRLTIKTYDMLPVCSMICLDPRSENAVMQVDQHLYDTEPRSRPCVLITKKEKAELFERYWNHHNFILGRSKDFMPKEGL